MIVIQWVVAHALQIGMVALTALEVAASLLGNGNLSVVIQALKGAGVKDVDGQ